MAEIDTRGENDKFCRSGTAVDLYEAHMVSMLTRIGRRTEAYRRNATLNYRAKNGTAGT